MPTAQQRHSRNDEIVVGLLDSAQHALAAVLLQDANNKGQAKSWLISTIAHLQLVPKQLILICFHPCYDPTVADGGINSRGSASLGSPEHPIAACRPAELQLLQLLMEHQPAAISMLLSSDSQFLCSYFTASKSNISSWFGHFSMAGIQHFKFGARALANWALTYRSEVWQLLVWAGKHDQAPVAVAAKPHYFCELDVQRTLRLLATDCPEFWVSQELLRSCEDGSWLKVDPLLAAQELQRLLHSTSSSRGRRLRQLLYSFLQEAGWLLLCNRVLPWLPDQQLSAFLQLLMQQSQQQRSKSCSPDDQQPPWASWQQQVKPHVSVKAPALTDAQPADLGANDRQCVLDQTPLLLGGLHSCWDLQQALLANALTCHRAQLLRLLQEEGAADHLTQLVTAARQLWQIGCGSSSSQQQQQQLQQPSTGSNDDTDAGATQDGVLAVAAVLKVVNQLRPFARPKHRSQLLLLGWLLRVELLLAAAAAGTAARTTAALQAQLQGQLQLVDGSVILTLADGSQLPAGQHQDVQEDANQQLLIQLQQQHEPQQQQQQQEQEQAQQAAGTGVQDRKPLRRGPSAPPSRDNRNKEQRRQGDTQQPGVNEHDSRRDSSSQRSSSAEDMSEDGDVGTSGRKKKRAKHTKHAKHRKRRRSDKSKHRQASRRRSKTRSKKHRHHSLITRSSSNGSSSEDDECMNSEDLDAGGQLLDLTDHRALHHAGSKGVKDSETASAGGKTSYAAEVVALLESLSLGGRLWSSPQWQVRIPSTTAQQQQQQADKLCVAGNTAQVMDALSCYWVWDRVRMSHPG